MKTDFFRGRKILVMGLGRFGGGTDAAKFAVNAGAKVTVSDIAGADRLAGSIKQLDGLDGIEFHLGSHREKDFEQAEIIIVNPAIDDKNRFLQFARRKKKLITSAVNIFFTLCPAGIIGITGANGKSTTAALASHILENARGKTGTQNYANVWLSGNIGKKPMLGLLDDIGENDLVVLELSSFQTAWLTKIQKGPKVALLTNLTPNHLDRYGAFAEYRAAKECLFKFQKADKNGPAVSLFNADDETGLGWFEKYKNDKDRLCIKYSAADIDRDIKQKFKLPGQANLSNLAAATAIAKQFGVRKKHIKESLAAFRPLAHRLEIISRTGGIDWYDDSISTTPESTIAALEALEGPTVIIAGGYDKQLPLEQLGQTIARRAEAVILIGQTAEKIAEAVRQNHTGENKQTKIRFADSLGEAVKAAYNLARTGGAVLLSPACASYGMFENFEHRSREFVKAVKQIKIHQSI